MHDPYAPHRDFYRPALGTQQLWRVLVVIVGFEIIFALSPSIFALFLPHDALKEAFFEGTGTFGTLAQFASFAVAGSAFVVLVKRLHGRGFSTLIGPRDAVLRDLWRVGIVVGFWMLVVEVAPPFIDRSALAETRDFRVWLALIPVTLAVLLIQVGTEEMFFRGYLQQQFACLSRSRVAWMVMPSVMFGAVHYWNGNGAAEGIIWAIWATLLGIACADLTARTGNLGAAIALHLVNNAFALLIVAVQDWPVSGVALYLYPYEDPDLYALGAAEVFSPFVMYQLAVMLLTLWIMWLAARIAIRR